MKRLLFLLILPFMAVSVMAQSYDEGLPVRFSGSSPGITDFLNAILSQEDCGELLGAYAQHWKQYRKGQKLSPGVKITVDQKNGYVCYEQTYPEDDSRVTVETCYWNCKDGRHKLIAQSIMTYQHGRRLCAQYDGITFYRYDAARRRMKWESAYDLCGEAFTDVANKDGTIISLPRIGKDVQLSERTATGKRHYVLEWTGNGFKFKRR